MSRSSLTYASSLALLEDSDSDPELDEILSSGPVFSQEHVKPVTPPKKSPTPSMKEEENVEQKAQRIAKSMSISIVDTIKSCDELYWYKFTFKRGRKTASAPFPVRICKSDEAIGLALKQKWDPTREELIQYLSHGDLNDLSLVAKSRLTRGLVPETNTWCPDLLQQYLAHLKSYKKKDALAVLLEKLYLEKIAERVHEKEARAPEEEDDEDEVISDDDDRGPLAPETKLPENKPRPTIASADGAPDRGEKLRAGDVIEYTNTIMVAGDPRGRRVATILSVRPKEEYRLVLDNGELLPLDTRIRRIQRFLNKKMQSYNGIRRAIEDHKLQGSSIPGSVGDGIMQEVKRIDAIIKANHEELLDRLEADGIPARGRNVEEIAKAAKTAASDNEHNAEESVKKSSGSATAETDNEETDGATVSVEARKAAAPSAAQGLDESMSSGSNVRKKSKDGLYQRPSGRAPKGMDWDAVKGIWVPLSNPDSAGIQATGKGAISDKDLDKDESMLKVKAPVNGEVPRIASTDAERKHQGRKRKLSSDEQMALPPSKRAAKNNSPTVKSASSR